MTKGYTDNKMCWSPTGIILTRAHSLIWLGHCNIWLAPILLFDWTILIMNSWQSSLIINIYPYPFNLTPSTRNPVLFSAVLCTTLPFCDTLGETPLSALPQLQSLYQQEAASAEKWTAFVARCEAQLCALLSQVILWIVDWTMLIYYSNRHTYLSTHTHTTIDLLVLFSF